MKKGIKPEGIILGVTFTLISVGLIMVYSSSAITAQERFQDSYYYLKRELVWIIVGILGMVLAAKLNYHLLKNLGKPLLLFTLALLILVLLPSLGKEVGGARRWFRLGPVNFQPSEMAKISVLLYLAAILSRKKDQITSFTKGLLPPLLILGLVGGLVLLQPDLGTAIILMGGGFIVIFISGARIAYLLTAILLSLPLLYKLVFSVEYRRRRILAFLNAWSDPSGAGYQIIQSFLALGSGGLWGKGLGQGNQKLFYLPAATTDFIFAIIGEELGFVGCILLLGLYIVFIWGGLKIAHQAPDLFGYLLASGITFLIILEALINIGAVTGILPTKGAPLPFVSFGGSSLVVNMVGVGLLLNISRQASATLPLGRRLKGWT